MKISAVQQPPVYLDLERTMERAIGLVAQAATDGCRMIVFPEAWFPGYPTFVWRFSPGADMAKTDALYARLLANCIDRSKGGLALLQEAAKEHAMVIVAGYQEVDGRASCSTIFNSVAIIDADGRWPTTTGS